MPKQAKPTRKVSRKGAKRLRSSSRRSVDMRASAVNTNEIEQKWVETFRKLQKQIKSVRNIAPTEEKFFLQRLLEEAKGKKSRIHVSDHFREMTEFWAFVADKHWLLPYVVKYTTYSNVPLHTTGQDANGFKVNIVDIEDIIREMQPPLFDKVALRMFTDNSLYASPEEAERALNDPSRYGRNTTCRYLLGYTDAELEAIRIDTYGE